MQPRDNGKFAKIDTSPLERILARVDKADGCWLWTGSKNDQGYGNIFIDGRSRKTHRVLFELMIGEIPNGLELDHLCRNRSCVNPAHMEPVTHQENMLRGVQATYLKTHCKRGHKLSEDNVYRHINKANGRMDRQCRRCLLDNSKRRYESQMELKRKFQKETKT